MRVDVFVDLADQPIDCVRIVRIADGGVVVGDGERPGRVLRRLTAPTMATSGVGGSGGGWHIVIWLGTSGWQYRDWRPGFYPDQLPQRLWLEHYAENFDTIEVNNAFYRLPERSTFEDWQRRAPSLLFAVKMSRFLTHIKRLRDPAEPVARFLDHAAGLAGALGPVLLQLPPTLVADADMLEETLRQFPRSTRVAVEPRHDSWWSDRIRGVLESHNAALCWADRKGRPVTPRWRTADWGYLRMHEGGAAIWPRYGRQALLSWVDRLSEAYGSLDTYVYFNNDPGGAAITDAVAFGGLARARGLDVSQYPSPAGSDAPYIARAIAPRVGARDH